MHEGQLKNNTLKDIIDDVKKKRSLPDNVEIKTDFVRQRISRGNKFVVTTKGGVTTSLYALEPTIVTIIIQMARIRQCLSPSKAIELVNSIIKGMPIQNELVKWKKKHCFNALGTIGKDTGVDS